MAKNKYKLILKAEEISKPVLNEAGLLKYVFKHGSSSAGFWFDSKDARSDAKAKLSGLFSGATFEEIDPPTPAVKKVSKKAAKKVSKKPTETESKKDE